MVAQLIDGKVLAEQINTELHRASLSPKGLGVVLIGENPASHIYIKTKRNIAERLNIPFELLHITEWGSVEELKEQILQFSNKDSLQSIILQMPLPGNLQAEELITCIPLDKDVDGLLPNSPFTPATARGVLYALKSTKQLLTGKHAVIIGRSKLVGRPLIDLLLAENCTVTIVHSYTIDLPSITKTADILISAVGKPGLVNADMVKSGVIAIDVGITRMDGKILGDMDFQEIQKKASFITPVPGGIGPLTVAFLMANVLRQ